MYLAVGWSTGRATLKIDVRSIGMTKKDADAKGEYGSGLLAEMQLVYHGPFYHPSSEVWY